MVSTSHFIKPGSRVLSGLSFTSSGSTGLERMLQKLAVTHANCYVVFLGVYLFPQQVFTIRAVKGFYQKYRESQHKNFPNSAG